MGLSQQEYWSGLPFSSPGDLPEPGIELVSLVFPAMADEFFTTEPPGNPLSWSLLDSLFTAPNRAKMRLIPQLNIY